MAAAPGARPRGRPRAQDGTRRNVSSCNNFGSYGWYNRRGERVDFMPEFDPEPKFAKIVRAASANRSALLLARGGQFSNGTGGTANAEGGRIYLVAA